MTPGTCTACGATCNMDRNSAGQCGPCHNKGYREYRQQRTAQVDAQREKGRAYWTSKGIQVGQKVKRTVVSWTGLQAEEVYGIAKVGAVGAYVKSDFQRGYLSAAGWMAA